MPRFSLRPARPDDLELAYRITENAMRPYVEATWGSWIEEDQRAKHALHYQPETHQLVLVESQEVGLLAVEEHADHVWLVKVYLFDAWRNQGIGRRLVEQVIARGHALSKPVRLRVLRVNERARSLYESLGFRVIEEQPERFIMEVAANAV